MDRRLILEVGCHFRQILNQWEMVVGCSCSHSGQLVIQYGLLPV